jgi:hypothetical protein
MTTELPKPIALYISLENGADTGVLPQCFIEHATVRDEGQTIAGLAAIQQWMKDTKKKYRHRMEPLAWVESGGKTIVTNRLAGDFPGSPITLEFVFTLEGDRIAALQIRPRATTAP